MFIWNPAVDYATDLKRVGLCVFEGGDAYGSENRALDRWHALDKGRHEIIKPDQEEGTMTKKVGAILLALALVLSIGLTPGVALASSGFPSTNDANRDVGHPHVSLVSAGEDYVTLEFVMYYSFLAFFEYRIDGEESPYIGTEWENTHPIVDEDGNWRYDDADFPDFTDPGPGNYYHLIGLDPSGNYVDPRVVHDTARIDTFTVNEKIEVRLALGAERDYDFDWVTFYVKEYDAAPAVAARLLEEAGIRHRYGNGPTGGNHVADVAHEMGSHEDDEKGTDFWGICKTDEFAYAYAIAEFLNTKDDPADVAYPVSALTSVVFIPGEGGGDYYGQAVGDDLVLTFSDDIFHDDSRYVYFETTMHLWDGWDAMSWDVSGNVLTVTTTRTFSVPRHVSGDRVVSVIGFVDAVGNPVVVPEDGVLVNS